MVTLVSFLLPRPTEEGDFLRLREIALVHDTWKLEYEKNGIKIWSKSLPDATTKTIKVWAIFSGFAASVLFNTLMDNIYRKEWDSNYIMGYDIGSLNSNNAVSYYATSCPPLKSRDFVLQSSWLERNSDYYILNHSVCHKDHPPRAGFVRAISYFTGYYLQPISSNGCEMTFVSQMDPQGMIPTWIVNKMTLVFAPRYIKKIEKAANGYMSWKVANPGQMPWLHPEQFKVNKIAIADCFPSEEERQTPFFRSLVEKELKMKMNDINPSEPLKESLPGTPPKSPEEIKKNQSIIVNSANHKKKGKRKPVTFLCPNFILSKFQGKPETDNNTFSSFSIFICRKTKVLSCLHIGNQNLRFKKLYVGIKSIRNLSIELPCS